MRVIIAGSRDISEARAFDHFSRLVEEGFLRHGDIDEIVSGTARGVDRGGEQWAERFGIPVKKFPADWEKYGKSAGFRRNIEMAEYADALVAIWDGKSRGTKHMIQTALGMGLKLFVITVT